MFCLQGSEKCCYLSQRILLQLLACVCDPVVIHKKSSDRNTSQFPHHSLIVGVSKFRNPTSKGYIYTMPNVEPEAGAIIIDGLVFIHILYNHPLV